MISAVIFDMDGLLIDSEPLWRDAVAYVFDTVGVHLEENDLRATMGRRLDEVVEYWHHECPWQGVSQKDIQILIINRLIELVKTKGKPMPGVHHILNFFTVKGLPMAIASSSYDEVINAVVDTLGLRHYFTEIYSAEHETHGKPHPGVYITTATRLSIPPHRCLVFEDSPSGVLAAKAAKMMCVAVPDKEHKSHNWIQIADAVIESLEDFDERLFSSL